MSTNGFKAGDRVRVTADVDGRKTKGYIGTISEWNEPHHTFYDVAFDDESIPSSDKFRTYKVWNVSKNYLEPLIPEMIYEDEQWI